MIRDSRLVAATIGLVALASSCMAQRQVVLTFDHAGPSNGAVEGEIRRSPITALTWDDRNGNGKWDHGTSYSEELFTWVPRHRLWVDFTEYVLEVDKSARSPAGNSSVRMWWCHPDDTAILPRTTWVAAGWPAPWIGYYRFNGRRFPAMTIYLDDDDEWITLRSQLLLASLGGGTATGQYDEDRPGWYGVCRVVEQDWGYPGNLFGYTGSVPNFIGVYSSDYSEGTLLFNWPWWGGFNFAIADCNRDCRISVQDIFDFLTEYAAGSVRGDADRNGTVDVGDVFAYLSAYFHSP